MVIFFSDNGGLRYEGKAAFAARTLNLDRPGIEGILDLVRSDEVGTVIVAKLDRLTRSVRDLAGRIELFERKGSPCFLRRNRPVRAPRPAAWS
jgi:DNA invertase Pin-like site-specific DNA recombinase